MRLRELQVIRLPGIDQPFTLAATRGLNLILGPNGSGKTSLCRAVSGLLWPGAEPLTPFAVTAGWELDGDRLHARREATDRTVWQLDGVAIERPALPEDHHAACYRLGILDLLKRDAGATDSSLARSIRRQMAGGFDLHRVETECFKSAPRAGRQARLAFQQARRQVTDLAQGQNELAEREDSLRSLERDLADCRLAAERLDWLSAIRRALAARRDLAAAERALETFPPVMRSVQENELEQLRELRDAHERALQQTAACRQAIGDAEAEIAATGLPSGPLAVAEIDSWRTSVNQCRDLQNRFDRATDQLTAAQARLAEAGGRLDPAWTEDQRAAVDMPALRAVEQYHRRSTANSLVGETLEKLIRNEKLRAAAELPDRQALRDAIAILERWLAASPAIASKRWWYVSLCVCVLLGALGMGMILVPGFMPAAGRYIGWLPAGLGLLGGLAVLLAGLLDPVRRRDRGERARCVAAFTAGGMPPPTTWSEEQVRSCKQELGGSLRDAEIQHLKHDLVAHLVAESGVAREQRVALAAERSRLVADFGIDPGTDDLELLVYAQRAQAFNEARTATVGAAAEAQHIEHELATELQRINTFISARGDQPVAHPVAAGRYIDELARRNQQHSNALELLERERRHLEEGAAATARQRSRIEAHFSRLELELDDDPGLAELVRQQPSFRAALDDRNQRRLDLESKLADLQQLPVPSSGPEGQKPWSEYSLEDIGQHIERERAAADRQTALSEQIGRIKAEVERARGEVTIEKSLAELDRTREALSAICDDEIYRNVGALLLAEIAAEHESTIQPPLLLRARRLFETFTFGRYRLVVQDDGREAEFRVVDTAAGEGRSLRQLSDGTRAQLLLAARLAFIFEHEREIKPPLFLDESLTASDPERFHAIACSLLALAAQEDRQIFYLTSNPADVRAWQRAARSLGLDAPHRIDLAQLRGLSTRADDTDLDVEPLPVVPPYTSQSAGAYGALLQVPRFLPQRPVGEIHLFHLLRDELPLLHTLLETRVDTVGQLRELHDSLAAAGTLTTEQLELLEGRCRLAEAFVENWRIGRGRPVDAQVLRDSGTVSDRFLAEVALLCDEVAGDGGRLLADLSAGKVKGFRKDKTEGLRRYFAVEGFIDAREILAKQSVRQRVLQAVEPRLRAATLSVDTVTQLVHTLWSSATGNAMTG